MTSAAALWRVRAYSIFAFLAVLAVHVVRSAMLNDGHFVYALDDAYIHLDLADTLFRFGTYGVNPGEASAPASSILWPLLLGLGVGTTWHVYVPLLLNAAFGAASVWVLSGLFARIFPLFNLLALWLLVIALLLGFGLVPLALIGMEHTLQIWLTLLGVAGIADIYEGKRPAAWFYVALLLGPIVRYENVLVSGAGLAALFYFGQRAKALLLGGAITILLVGFSLFLLRQGLDFLPSSILVKNFSSSPDWLSLIARRIDHIVSRPTAGVMALGLVAALGWCLFKARVRGAIWFVTLLVAAVLAGHLVVGQFGGWMVVRYEPYALIFALLLGLFVWRAEVAGYLTFTRGKIVGAAVLGLVCLTNWQISLFFTQGAMQGIYTQQYQTMRFVHDFWKKPVAVHDIGLVGFKAPDYVLDLWGLASREARLARFAGEAGWVAQLADKHGVDLTIIYPYWFTAAELAGWSAAGVSCRALAYRYDFDCVAFFVRRPEMVAEARAALRAWQETLPRGTLYIDRDDISAMLKND